MFGILKQMLNLQSNVQYSQSSASIELLNGNKPYSKICALFVKLEEITENWTPESKLKLLIISLAVAQEVFKYL